MLATRRNLSNESYEAEVVRTPTKLQPSSPTSLKTAENDEVRTQFCTPVKNAYPTCQQQDENPLFDFNMGVAFPSATKSAETTTATENDARLMWRKIDQKPFLCVKGNTTSTPEKHSGAQVYAFEGKTSYLYPLTTPFSPAFLFTQLWERASPLQIPVTWQSPLESWNFVKILR